MSTILVTYTLFGKSLGFLVLQDWKRQAFWAEPIHMDGALYAVPSRP